MHDELTLGQWLYVGGCLSGLALVVTLEVLAIMIEVVRYLASRIADEYDWESPFPRSSMNGTLPLYVVDAVQGWGFWPQWGWRPWTVPSLLRALWLLSGCLKRGLVTTAERERFIALLGPTGARCWDTDVVAWLRKEFAA